MLVPKSRDHLSTTVWINELAITVVLNDIIHPDLTTDYGVISQQKQGVSERKARTLIKPQNKVLNSERERIYPLGSAIKCRCEPYGKIRRGAK